jgi:hypothetical protein
MDTVAVIRIILGRVNASLRGNGMRSARTVLDAKNFHLITQLGQGCGRRRSGQAGTDDQDLTVALIARIDELDGRLVVRPFVF